ncbi:MAG: alpha/beta fold hydrolase [Pseudomonadales bacterium]|jgi:polyhydroxyalkanoate synthase|nr:alpha/beta fold hydrolase [Pseudomonadales bacterium]
MTPTSSDSTLQDSIRRMVDRTIQRGVNGFRYVTSAPPAVGLTPKDVIHERGTLRLYHYHPIADEIYRVPVLLVMATTNRAYVFDLAPGQSMVQYLLEQGFDVYVIDWDPPSQSERGLDLDDYTQDFLPTCVRLIAEDCGEPDVSIVGYCMGGVLSLIYAATHADGPLKNLACLTTPVNWHGMGLMARWSDRRFFDVDRLVDTLGIVPADFVSASFDMLRPAQKPAGRLRVWEQMWNDEFVKSYRAFDRWGEETLPLAGEYFRQTTKDLMWDNKLYNGTLVAGRQRVDLGAIRVPVMHITAEHDHIVSTEASAPLLQQIGSEDRTELVLKGGHVSLIAGPNAVRRMWPALSTWLAERST